MKQIVISITHASDNMCNVTDEMIEELIKYLVEKEAETNVMCRSHLTVAKGIVDGLNSERRVNEVNTKFNTIVQDYNYAQGQRNLCRIILRHYLGVKDAVVEPDYEILGEDTV